MSDLAARDLAEDLDRPDRTASKGTEPIELAIGGMSCAACAARIEKRINQLDGARAVVNIHTAFEPEARLQAATEIFHAAKTQAAAGVAAAGQAGHAFALRGDVADGRIHHAKESHVGGLRRCARSRSQCRKGKKCFFHAVHGFE